MNSKSFAGWYIKKNNVTGSSLKVAQPAQIDKIDRNKSSYPFVNCIRFICIMGIVWAHVDVFTPDGKTSTFLPSENYMLYFIPYKQIFKFSVICFFIISGFLLGDKIDETNAITYFKRRLKTTLRPYIIAFLIFFGLILVREYIFDRHILEDHSLSALLKFCFFDTLFWYLPNYLLGLSIILAFKKHIRSIYFGIALLVVTLIYSLLTVYIKEYQSGHGTAILGFVFYLWLGVYIYQKNLFKKFLTFNLKLVGTLTFVLFVLSCIESYWLFTHNSPTYFNILRLFNQLYSISMFVFLVRVFRLPVSLKPFNPRKETYGIYLYHGLFVYFVVPKVIVLCNKYLEVEIYAESTFSRLLLMTLYAIICYLLTTLFVKTLSRFKLAYL